MRKIWKGVLLGAVIGAGIKAVQEVQGDDDLDQVGPAVAKAAGQAALAGAAVGLLLDLKAGRKRKKLAARAKKAGLSGALATAGALAEAARPAVEAAAEAARDRAARAAKEARPRIEAAVDAAKPMVEAAMEAAKPTVEHVTDLAKVRAARAAGAARSKLHDLDLPTIVAV
jgi:hypothetical protein